MLKQVFVVSPLSSKAVEKLSLEYGCSFEQITLTFLKNLGIISTLKILRSTSEMRVVFEDTESEKLTDFFLALLFFTKSKNSHFTRADLSTFSLNKRDAALSLIKTMFSLVFGFYCAIKMFVISKTLVIKYQNLPIESVKRVLYFKTNFWFGIQAGGSVAHVEGVISGFKKKGISIDYAGVDCSSSLSTLIQDYYPLRVPKFLSPIFSLNLYTFDNLIYKYFKKKTLEKYNFIYHRMALNSLSAVRLAQHLRLPLIVEYNGSEVWVQRNWGRPLFLERISQAIENTILRCATYIVVVSDVLKEELLSKGISEKRIICYPNCVDPEKFNPLAFSQEQLMNKRKRLGLSDKDIVLTFVGTFGKWHGVEVLAQTIKLLYTSDPNWIKNKSVKFLLVGDGACMPEVKRILSSIPSKSNFVTFAGLIPQEQTPEILALSDVLLSPHSPPNLNERFFGSPTKLFEYMAMKKVIIASELEQIREVLSPYVHIDNVDKINEACLAVLCTPGNGKNLAKAIKYAVNKLSNLTFLGENTRQKVVKKYTWEKHIEKIFNAIGKPLT